MTEVLFYHLQNMTLESVLPPLLEKSLERGWRVVVQSTSQERAETLDAHLWTYSDDSFLPHASARVADAQDQPIVLSIEESNPNRANVRFLVSRPIATATSAWSSCSTVTTPMRSPRPGRTGPLAKPAASRSPIGRPTSGDAGSGANSDID